MAWFISTSFWFCSEGRFVSSMPYQFIFAYLIPVLVGILGANVQGTTQPIFKTHTLNMWSFLVSQAIYCFAFATDIKSLAQQENSTKRSGIIAITSGSLSAISLVSTFLQGSSGHIILYISWPCAVVIVVYHQYGRLFIGASLQLYHDTLKPIFTNIWNWFRASCLQLYHATLKPFSAYLWDWFRASCLQLYHETLKPFSAYMWNWFRASCLQLSAYMWNWFQASCLQLYQDTLKPLSAYIWNWFRASCLQLYHDTLKPLSAYIWNWSRASCLQLYHDTLKPFFTNIWNGFQAKENISSTDQQGPQAEV